MKKNLISTLAAAAVVCAVLMMSIFFASCKKLDQTWEKVTPKVQSAVVDTTIIHIGNNVHQVSRDINGVTVVSHNGDTGEDFNGYYPLGWASFWCAPNDTTVGTPVVHHYSLDQLAVQSYELDTLDCHVTKTVKPALDGYDQFNKNCGISFLNGYAIVFGDTLHFPQLVADLHYQTHSASQVGADAEWVYNLITITYKITSNFGDQERNGYKTLKMEVGDELVSITKTNEGWQPLTYSSWGWPLTAKSWIELTYHYSQSGDQVQIVEQILNYSVSTPNDTIIIRQNFNISWATPQLGNVIVLGSTTANNITVTSKRQNYSVGGTGFTRRFVFYWQTAVWSDGDYTFDMPSYPFTGYAETHTLDDLAPISGYQQKKAINTVSASLNGVNGSAPANTTIRVAEQEPPTPTIDHYEVIDEGLTYVNPTTNNSWIKLRPVYTDGSYGTPFNKDVNLSNAMTCPNIGPEIVSSFDDVDVVGAGQTGADQLLNTYTVGDFTIKQYRKTFTVNLGEFTMTWNGTYEKAVYNPLNHNMPSSVYTYAVSSGTYTADLGQTLTQNTTYNRKTWTQYITATLNQHTQQHAGTAEVWAPNYIPRQTPSQFGELLDGKYTRVQPAYGQNFQDCIAFLYENGVVLIINGNTSNPLMFAKTATLAGQLGIPQMGNPNFWYSAEYHDGSWWPAKITNAADWSSWVYVADAQHQHTCNRNNAQECNIGYEYKPIPVNQTFTKNGDVGTISYCVNNTSGTMNASVTFW